ncbi:MAG: N-acyl-D-amino-acid deacylase family protein [Thermovirgaceae bacterium]
MHDMILKNAKIIDGTGGPWFRGDVAIDGGRIAGIGKYAGNDAAKVLDMEDRVLCPGFIDPHSHADIIATEVNPQNQIFQGVTTQVTGNCGKSNAPVKPGTRPFLERYLAAYTPEGVRLGWDWTSLGDWLDIIDRQGYVTDIGVLIGQGTIRMAAMGMSDSDPSNSQLEEMKQLVAESMSEGALGLSTGLIYPPGSFTKMPELVELCKVVAQFGGIYATHMRSEGAEHLSAIEEAIRIGRESGCKVHVSHHKITHPYDGQSKETLGRIEAARKEGIDITFDVYPYTAGFTQITTLIPTWATVGGVDAMLERLRSRDLRKRIAGDQEHGVPGWENFAGSAGWDGIIVSSTKADRSVEGKSISRIAEERGTTCSEALFDIILAEKAEASVVVWSQSEADHERIITHPLGMIGSDGFPCNYDEPRLQGKPHPRCLGTFPRVLGRYVREKKLLDLETAVWKMTGFTAQRFGLHDRGLVKEGLLADLVVFDPERIEDGATFDDPFQKPEGIEWVIKNGKVLVERNEHVGGIIGRTVRSW